MPYGDAMAFLPALDSDSLIAVFVVLAGLPYTLWARRRLLRQGARRLAFAYTLGMSFVIAAAIAAIVIECLNPQGIP